MTYLVLARRTRPQSLTELVGQNSIRDALKGMLDSKKIPHAFLLTGTRGTGKTSTARILAKSLNCEQGPVSSPCHTCRHCLQVTACAHEDVLEIDGASNTGVDNIRELRESARFHPISARYKVFIIDEVHMLSTGAFNALLKTLEEPPSQVIFILATTELHKVPITVKSRCITFAFKKIESNEIVAHLGSILNNEDITYHDDALKLIARESQGSLRDALSLLEQVLALQTSQTKMTLEETKQTLGLYSDETALLIFCGICRKEQGTVLKLLQDSDASGLDLSIIIESVANYFRHALVLSASNKKPFENKALLVDEQRIIEEHRQKLNTSALSEVFKILAMSVKDMRRSMNPLSWAEIIVIDAISRAEWLSASDMLLQLQTQLLESEKKERKQLEAMIAPQKEPKNQQKQDKDSTDYPSVSTQSSRNIEEKEIDLNLYKQFVKVATKRSVTLGARLNFIKLEVFTKTKIRFADTVENKTYLAFDKIDQQHFWDSLEEVGINPDLVKNKSALNESLSLHDIAEGEKKKSFKIKEKEVLSRDSVKNLMILSKEIQLTPIEN